MTLLTFIVAECQDYFNSFVLMVFVVWEYITQYKIIALTLTPIRPHKRSRLPRWRHLFRLEILTLRIVTICYRTLNVQDSNIEKASPSKGAIQDICHISCHPVCHFGVCMGWLCMRWCERLWWTTARIILCHNLHTLDDERLVALM